MRISDWSSDVCSSDLADGSQVRLRDVARVEVGSDSYNVVARYNGQPAAGLGVKLAAGANALDTAAAVRARVAELEPFFPPGMEAIYPYDTTPFVRISIEEVVKTLAEAIVLVFRSEEHTSELQSLMRISYAVFCLKKKKTQNTPSITT